jgi:aminoglycoside phosphotransferase (APT) family kinase protein
VLTDDGARLAAYDEPHALSGLERRAAACGDPGAVLVAPQLLVGSDPTTVLNVFGSRDDASIEGRWTPLEDLVDTDPAVVESLREVGAVVDGVTARPARRPEWFRASWYDEADAWIDDQLASLGRSRTGATVPVKVWSLSAVLRVPCAGGPVWMKASCRHFHAEPALTRLVAEMLPEHAPPIIAADEERAWLLLDDMTGADEQTPPSGIGAATARIAATLQLRSLDHLDAIGAAGVPVRGLAETTHAFDDVLASSVELDELSREELATARALRPEVQAVFEELASLGLPDTLVHGDLHPGNVAHAGDSVILYDWSDAAVSHPFLDLVHLNRSLPDDEAALARAASADVWRGAYPHVDLDRAFELASAVNAIFQTVTFEEIYRAQEDASYWEMRGVVARYLRQLPDRFPPRT